MAKLIYSAIASLDGYVADQEGNFDWAAPDEEVHAFVNELGRPIGTYLFGRRMYEVMVFWETLDTGAEPPVMRDYAQIWRAADKIVYSTTLEKVSSARTRIERSFDPEAIRRLKAAAGRDIGVGGPALAGQALRAGLVDECQFFLTPVAVGGGQKFLPDSPRVVGAADVAGLVGVAGGAGLVGAADGAGLVGAADGAGLVGAADGRIEFELLDLRRFSSGVVYLSYRVRT